MEIVDRLFEAGDCELEERTVGGTGYRRLLANTVTARVHVPDPRKKVTIDSSPLLQAK
jgi:hypothetical protein